MDVAGPQTFCGYVLQHASGPIVPPTAAAPPEAPPSVYVGGNFGELSAFSAADGALRWSVRFVYHRPVTPTGLWHNPRNRPPPTGILVGQPLLLDQVLYVALSGSGAATCAVNASDGALRWLRETDVTMTQMGYADYALPVVESGSLYSGRSVLDQRDGTVRWQLPALDESGASVAAVIDSTLYAYTGHMLAALNAGSGALRWKHEMGDVLGAVPVVVADLGAGDKETMKAPAAAGAARAGSGSGTSSRSSRSSRSSNNTAPIIAVGWPEPNGRDASSGQPVWSAPTGRVCSIASDPTTGLVYFGTVNGLLAVEARTGRRRWHRLVGTRWFGTPFPRGDTVYCSADGVYAFAADDGALRWHNPLGASRATGCSPVTELGGRVFVAHHDEQGTTALFALSAHDGRALWQVSGVNQFAPPVAG